MSLLATRPYQDDALERARARLRAGVRRLLIVSPTGSGKSVLAGYMAAGAAARTWKTLLLAHRLELVDQLSDKLDKLGLDHGVIQASHWRKRPWCPLQIASVPTLARRESSLPEASLVMTDEAHHCTSATFHRILDWYPKAVHIGLTATPYRLDGRGLASQYDELLVVAQVQDLVDQGYLVPSVVFAPSAPDLRGVTTTGGDWNRRQLSDVMDKPRLIGDCVETWLEHAQGRTTVAFCVDVAHSQRVVERFRAAGITAEHLDFETHPMERRAILARVARGETQVLSNVQLVTEGWDVPRVSCVLKLRPTQSKGLDRQMEGRGMRPWCPSCDGMTAGCQDPRHKRETIVLDHAGNYERFGYVAWPETFSLAGDERKRKDAAPLPQLRTCAGMFEGRPGCYAVNPASSEKCQWCGRPFPPRPRREVREEAGRLVRQRPEQIVAAARGAGVPLERRHAALAKWMREGRQRGYSKPEVRAEVIFRRFFGVAVDDVTRTRAQQLLGVAS